MKKVKIILSSILATIVTVFMAFAISTTNNQVQAASTLRVRYNSYKADDYAIKNNFDTVYGFDYDTAKADIDGYNAWVQYNIDNMSDLGFANEAECIADGAKWWAGEYLDQSASYAGSFPVLGTMPETTFTYTANRRPVTVTVSGEGYSLETVKAAVEAYDNVSTTTQFSVGDRVVIEPIVQATNLAMITVHLNHKTFANDSATITYYEYEKSAPSHASGPQSNFPTIGWGYVDGTTFNEEVAAGAFEFEIGNFNGNVTVGMYTGASGNQNNYNDGSNWAYNNSAQRGNWIETPLTLTIVGQNNDTSLKNLTVNNTDILSNSGTETIAGTSYTSYTSPAVSSANATLIPTPTSGTVEYVKYATTLNGVLGGSVVTASGNAYSIPMSSVSDGGTMYVAISVRPSDNSDPQVYIVKIPKPQDTDNTLDGITFTANGGGAITTTKLYASATSTSETTFNKNTTEYWLAVDNKATSIIAVPTLNSPKTGTITGTTGNFTSGSSYTINITNNNEIVVTVQAQDTTVAAKTYTFHVVKKSTDTSLPSGAISASPLTVTYDAANKKFVVTGLAYGERNYTLTPDLKAGQTATIGGTAVSDGVPGNRQFNFVSNNYNAQKDTLQFVVTSEFGTTETYQIEVQMDAADTDTSVNKVYVIYADPNGGPADHELTANASGNYVLTGVPSNVSDFKIMIQLPNGAKQTIGYNMTSASAANTALASGAQSSSISFGNSTTSVTKTAYVKITAENPNNVNNFTIAVTRDAQSNDTSISNISITDNLGNEVGVWNETAQSYTISNHLPFSTTSVKIEVEATNAYATAKINNQGTNYQSTVTSYYSSVTTASDGTKTITFTVIITAQNGTSSSPLVINVVRDGADNTIDYTITATVDGASAAMTTSSDFKTSTSVTRYAYEAAEAKFTLTPVKSTTTYWIGTRNITNTEYTFALDPAQKNQTDLSVQVIAKTEADPAGTTITIKFQRAAAEDDRNITFYLVDTFGQSFQQYTAGSQPNSRIYVLDTTDTNFSINASGYSSKSKVYVTTDVNETTTNPISAPIYSETATYAIGDRINGNTVYLVVESQRGLKTVYTIIAKSPDRRSNDATISSVVVSDGDTDLPITQQGNEYVVTVPFSTRMVQITVTPNHAAASLATGSATYSGRAVTLSTNGGKNLNQGANYFYYQVKAENETKGNVICVRVQRNAGLTDDYILSLKIQNKDCMVANTDTPKYFYTPFDSTMTTGFVFIIPRTSATTVRAQIDFTISSGAKYEISTVGVAGSTQNSSADNPTEGVYRAEIQPGNYVTITIKVSSEAVSVGGGLANEYTFQIYVAEQNMDIDNVEIFDKEEAAEVKDVNDNIFVYDPTKTTQTTFTVPFTVDTAYLKITPNSNFAVKDGAYGLQSLRVGTNRLEITLRSEYGDIVYRNTNTTPQGQSKKITVVVVRESADTVKTLSELKVSIGGSDVALNPVFNPATNTYVINNISESASQATISWKKTSAKSKAYGDEGVVSLALSDTTFVFNVFVESEEDVYNKGKGQTISPNKYTITISRTVYQPSNVNDISGITVRDADNKEYIPQPFNASQHNYTINLPATKANATITVTKSEPKSTLSFNQDGAGYQGSTDGIWYVTVPAGGQVVVQALCTAEDNTQGTPYVLTINRADLDKDARLKSLSVNGTPIPGFNPDNDTYTLYVPNSTATAYLSGEVNKATSSITSNNNGVDNPKTLLIGENTLTITVTAEDSSTTKTYTVKIVKDAENTLSDLKALVDGNDTITYADGTYNYTSAPDPLAYDKDKITIVYTPKSNTGLVIEISYVDENGQTITVTRSNAVIPLLTGTNTIKVSVKPRSVTEDGQTANQVDYTITVNRESGSTDAYIEKYIMENGEELILSKNQFTYSYVLPKGTQTYNPTITLSNNAYPAKRPNGSIPSNILEDVNRVLYSGIANVKTLKVTSQDGSTTNEYTFNVYVADSNTDPLNDPMITDINVLDKRNGNTVYDWDSVNKEYTSDFVDYVFTTTNYNLVVPYSVEKIFLEILTNKNTVVVKKSEESNQIGHPSFVTYTNALQDLDVGLNEFYIYAVSEYGTLNPSANGETTNVYKITIEREAANNDATLKEITIKYTDDQNQLQTVTATATDLANRLFVIENIGNTVTSIEIEGIPTVSTTQVNGRGQKTLQVYNTETGTGYTFPFTLDTKAEDGSTLTYNITISRGPVDLNSDHTLNYIQVVDSMEKEYLGPKGNTQGEEFSAAKDTYEYKIPYGTQSVTIRANKLAASPAKVFIYESTGTETARDSASLQINITKDMLNTTKEYIVFVRNEKGDGESTRYTIALEFTAPSTDAKLATLTADGAAVPGFDPTNESLTNTYTLPTRPNNVTSITIAATATDPSAKVDGVGQYMLNVGLNTIVVTITAEDGTQAKHAINVMRDYPDPYLTDLSVVGEQLKDENKKDTEFDPETKSYYVVVSYATATATINASVDNKDYMITCGNATLVSNTDLSSSFAVNLVENTDNAFTINVTSPEQKTVEYKLIIRRRGIASTYTGMDNLIIEEVNEFDGKYNNGQTLYGVYEVENKIRDLTIKATLDSEAYGEGATWQAFNDKDLAVGVNNVIVIVTAGDGETTRVVVVQVTRKEMNFTVDEKATDFECVKDDKEENKYTIDLKKNKASAIKDYAKYIVFDSEDNLEVKVLSDTSKEDCSEVIVSVSDGSEERIVTFKLLTDAPKGGTTFPIWIWILLGIILLLLIIILICVNRDKYGSILKKRKRLK